jgi:Flp pilus assembly protein TadB
MAIVSFILSMAAFIIWREKRSEERDRRRTVTRTWKD